MIEKLRTALRRLKPVNAEREMISMLIRELFTADAELYQLRDEVKTLRAQLAELQDTED